MSRPSFLENRKIDLIDHIIFFGKRLQVGKTANTIVGTISIKFSHVTDLSLTDIALNFISWVDNVLR